MARLKGSKNKPKSVEYHLEQLRQAGYKFPDENEDEIGVIGEGEFTTKKDLKINTGADSEEVFTCGNCKLRLDGELELCPHCGAVLQWR